MRSIPIAAIACVALLGGCGGRSQPAANSSNAAAPAVHSEMPDLTANAMAAAADMPKPTSSPVAITAIPATFQGRWGMVANDCDPAKAEVAKGSMVIAGNHLTFYESRGDATNLRLLSPDRIGFDLPMSGEGRQWSEPTTLTMLGDGRTLVREAMGSPDRTGSFPYHRCPA